MSLSKEFLIYSKLSEGLIQSLINPDTYNALSKLQKVIALILDENSLESIGIAIETLQNENDQLKQKLILNNELELRGK